MKFIESETVELKEVVVEDNAAIRSMIKETDGDTFENLRALEQNLTFFSAEKEFSLRNIDFEVLQKKTLGLLTVDDIYTNLGLLLSEQCMHTIKAAVFEGDDQSVFKDRREFSGSLLQQLNDVYEYIDFHNETRSTFDKLRRIDTKDYPDMAVREALLNCVIHRDYSFVASTIISIYKNRIEFISIGGLMSGISLDDVLLGLSVCRNPKLANVFYRLELIEAYGTGIRKILNSYERIQRQPEIITTGNAFKIILPNINDLSSAASETTQNFSAVERVINMSKSKKVISRKEVESELGISQPTASRLLKQMIKDGLIIQEGKGKNTRYKFK